MKFEDPFGGPRVQTIQPEHYLIEMKLGTYKLFKMAKFLKKKKQETRFKEDLGDDSFCYHQFNLIHLFGSFFTNSFDRRTYRIGFYFMP